MIPRTRAKPRRWTCVACQARQTGVKTCAECGTRKTTKRTGLREKCDRLARELCRRLADNLCARCGNVGSDWAHRLPRRHFATRWSMDDCDFLCRKCHQYLTTHPAANFAFIVRQMGSAAAYEDLERRANEPWNRDYAEIIGILECALAALPANMGKVG